ncbi:MAG: hypothetical protein NTX72_06100 [Candidatus Uhrbacteria bacterium]|nr:hypothetical protein [Candidatus Uhrbacteria bacterium]
MSANILAAIHTLEARCINPRRYSTRNLLALAKRIRDRERAMNGN